MNANEPTPSGTEGFVLNDGGASAAGYVPGAHDCVVRAISIATERPYVEVLSGLRAALKKSRKKTHPRGGMPKRTTRAFLAELGWEWVPLMGIGTGCRVHLRASELPSGRLIVAVSKHLVAVLNGVIHDTYDPRRETGRCVYGYWRKAVSK